MKLIKAQINNSWKWRKKTMTLIPPFAAKHALRETSGPQEDDPAQTLTDAPPASKHESNETQGSSCMTFPNQIDCVYISQPLC